MRVLTVVRDDERLARRLHPPASEAADELRRRYALGLLTWFHLCLPEIPEHSVIIGCAGRSGAPLWLNRRLNASGLDPLRTDRKSVGEGKSGSVHVQLGCARSLKEK